MKTEVAIPTLRHGSVIKAGNYSPMQSPVKVAHLSSPPPLIENTSGILEDGEINEEQDEISSLRSKLAFVQVPLLN